MKGLLLGTVTAVALAAMATSAQAADRHGWYFGLEGGIVHTDNNSSYFGDQVQYENGWAGLAQVGYAFDGHWRVELEGGMRRNEVDKIGGIGSVDGADLRNYTGFVNAI